ncbi:MAG: hypothetical protein V3U16_02875 [Candidatus Neomarinimicrobiota bacterium]
MDLINGLIIIAVFAGTVIYSVQPLIHPVSESIKEQDDDIASLKIRKRILYRAIKELEMDYEVGKFSDDDYNKSRLELKREISEIIVTLRNTKK